AKLVLTGRAAFPSRHAWHQWLHGHPEDDATSGTIRRLLVLESLGAEVLPISADVADQERMGDAIRFAEQRFGTINGVMHCAGLTGSALLHSIQDTTVADCQQQFQSKAHGLIVLERVLRGRQLDFAVLFSSLSSILGGLGLTAYAAANL